MQRKTITFTLLFLITIFIIFFIKNSNGSYKLKKYNEDIFVLVNYENELPKNYNPKLVEYKGFMISEIILNNLMAMEFQASIDGIELVINNAYRNRKTQKMIFNDSIKNYQKKGYSYDASVSLTKKTVSYAGFSEHETGLAIDFSESGNSEKNKQMWEWLNQNAYKYGFILRYPENKENITKIDFEPWHYRYVGSNASIIIKKEDLSLEEYLLKYIKGE